mmetsp:Transcript_11113/g.16827  ORF Transcript_11113/g.16827 Transcript_11113/m.16827 type:complete len:92 (+) Transcript_11113:164-439(+)
MRRTGNMKEKNAKRNVERERKQMIALPLRQAQYHATKNENARRSANDENHINTHQMMNQLEEIERLEISAHMRRSAPRSEADSVRGSLDAN